MAAVAGEINCYKIENQEKIMYLALSDKIKSVVIKTEQGENGRLEAKVDVRGWDASISLPSSRLILAILPPSYSRYNSERDKAGTKPDWHRHQTYSTPHRSSLHQSG